MNRLKTWQVQGPLHQEGLLLQDVPLLQDALAHVLVLALVPQGTDEAGHLEDPREVPIIYSWAIYHTISVKEMWKNTLVDAVE